MKVVSLFAGCGGLDLGFERAGFNVVWANEFDKAVWETYRFNHPQTTLNTSDIRILSGRDIPDCDGIIGGPPCQAWSEGGKQLGILDPRGQLFLEYIRVVKEKKPKFFLIENVQGILADQHRNALNEFMYQLKEIGYRITYELLNAANYKVPQDRFRVFFIGIRNDLKNKFQFPDAVCNNPITLRQAIGDISMPPKQCNKEELIPDGQSIQNHDVYMGPYDRKYMSRQRVRSWNEPSFTIQAQARNIPLHPDAPKMTYISPSERAFAKGYEHLYRRMSVRECARIQTFPDSFKFIYSDVCVGYKMVGNAVPPRLAWFLAMQLKIAFTHSEALPMFKLISINNLNRRYSNGVIRDIHTDAIEMDMSNRVLIGLVKNDNVSSFLNRSARIYYTGKNFPASIALNELYYFMPYIKGKGVSDLYLIKRIRIGNKQEVYPDCTANDKRLFFDIEYVKQLFSFYQPIHLNIWHTFTDTVLRELMKLNNNEEEH